MFDVAREPLEAKPAGWVFRSDAPGQVPVVPAPKVSQPARPAPAAPAPSAVAPRPAGRVDRMLSPVALALTILLAPFSRFGGPRARR